jgi:hypothetical protein
MANRIVDLLITYRIVKLISTPWEQQEAFKFGIIDKNGNVLKKSNKLNTEVEKDSYTILHRFVFNLKRILQKVGMGSSLSSFAVALAFILKEDKELVKHKSLIESTVVSYLKQIDVYDKLLNEVRVIKENKEEPFITCFGIDVYEKDGELISEYENV